MCPHCVVMFLMSLPFVAGIVKVTYTWYRGRKARCHEAHHHEHCCQSSPLDQM